MRKSALLCSLPLLLTLTLPVLLHGQFQQPDPNELKMTSDPMAPGAAAVYLEVKEIDNDPIHLRTVYARIKVLTEKGKELATVEIPYEQGSFKVQNIRGRTIHPDGTIVPLTGNVADLLQSKSTEGQVNRRVFTLPSVEVGSVLEYQYELGYNDQYFSSPSWEIQRPYFIHEAHYMFTPYKEFAPHRQSDLSTTTHLYSHGNQINSLLWTGRLPVGASVQSSAGGYYTLDLTNVPPIPEEEWMPPMQSVLYKIDFYYTSSGDAANFWATQAKAWAKETDKFAEPNEQIKQAVAGLTASTDSDLDKAKKLYAAVEALDNTDYSRARGESELKQLQLKEAKHASDVWTQKSGDSNEIAMLYLAMLRAAGLRAYTVQVVDRGQRIFDSSYINFNQFGITLVIVDTGGKEIILDPGEKMCTFGMQNWRHSGTAGVRESAAGLEFVNLPEQDFMGNTTMRIGDVSLDEHGALTGTLRLVMSGQEALRWRQTAIENSSDEVKKQFDRWLDAQVPEGVEAHVDHFIGMDNADAQLMAVVNVKGSMGTATAKRLMVPDFFFATHSHEPFVDQQKRQTDVDMHYGEQVIDQVAYHLPAGVTVEGTPQDLDTLWKGYAVYTTETVASAGQVLVKRTLARGFMLAKPEEYQDLRGFYEKVAAGDQEQLVLSIAPTAPATVSKGN
jgi:Domain of Unknown Function with PDB structure (DUF3857)/Transglutaminase-like superfamily